MTVRGVRAALPIRMKSEDLLHNYDSLNMGGSITWINTCLSSKGITVKFRILLRLSYRKPTVGFWKLRPTKIQGSRSLYVKCTTITGVAVIADNEILELQALPTSQVIESQYFEPILKLQ